MPISDAVHLRTVIIRKIQSGILPVNSPRHTWGGTGTDRPCAVCDELTTVGRPEIEAHCVDSRHRFYHVACFEVLELIRGELA